MLHVYGPTIVSKLGPVFLADCRLLGIDSPKENHEDDDDYDAALQKITEAFITLFPIRPSYNIISACIQGPAEPTQDFY